MEKTSPLWPDLPLARQRYAVWIASGLGMGLASPAPGTVGGLWGVPLAWALGELQNSWTQCGLIALLACLGASFCTHAAQALGSDDPPEIVLDEIVALPLVFVASGPLNWPKLLVGFLLFRVFDVLKPRPIRWFEQISGGWGIMADDLVAALFAMACLAAVSWVDVAAGWNWLQPAD